MFQFVKISDIKTLCSIHCSYKYLQFYSNHSARIGFRTYQILRGYTFLETTKPCHGFLVNTFLKAGDQDVAKWLRRCVSQLAMCHDLSLLTAQFTY